AALVVPSQESLEYWAKSNGIEFTSYSELLEREETRRLIEEEINRAQADMPGFEQVKRF
ncbi:MAG: long-chain fatty acid--CoA ligase, partial [candidate division Zixibacteria bacterium]|nr:long-chain fatty acid--CoA ligase [candidate division Zixibacteria bacterium]NIW42211.1 hypothetical protein [candidate division Zixibacteria bacterium]NIX54966.1 hypothetical protein [candidate division Zixibacteria bacterium]